MVTYKSKSPNPEQALLNAEKILLELDPEETTDIETLGLSGAINKRLFEITKDTEYLKKSVKYYEKGFYINEDYYNGINLAYLYNVLSSVEIEKGLSKSHFFQARFIRERIIGICNQLISDKNFKLREDKHWIYQSLAQAYLGLDKTDELEAIIPLIDEYSNGQFDLDTFKRQNKNLIGLIIDTKEKFKITI